MSGYSSKYNTVQISFGNNFGGESYCGFFFAVITLSLHVSQEIMSGYSSKYNTNQFW